MRFEQPRCLKCGELATGTLETLSGRANLNFDDDGTANWSGETTVFWDEQRTVRDGRDRVTLLCGGCGADWPSATSEDEQLRPPTPGLSCSEGEHNG